MSNANYSLTIRAAIPARVGMLGRVMAAIGEAGGQVGGVDIARSTTDAITRDITVYARDEAHAATISRAVEAVEGVVVESTIDRVFMSHAGGKIGMRNRVPVATRDDLSMAYTPGVARVCMAIHDDPDAAWDYTIKGNSVMVVSDGSSVVGQGDLGAIASLPALEGKAALLQKLAGIDAFPLPVDLRDPAEIAEAVVLISSVFAGIHLSDIAAPRCFEVQRLIAERVDVPVFHEDQEGTAAAVLAALTNGLTVAGTAPADATVVVAGLGPGGQAVVRLLVAAGVGSVIACDSRGAVHAGREGTDDEGLAWIAEHTNPERRTGGVRELVRGADAFVGLSAPGILSADDVRAMAADPVVLALAMPDPELLPADAAGVARVYATGRPDVPNQINSGLASPGIWRGALDCRATEVTQEMTLAAAQAIAATAAEDAELSPVNVVPSIFSARLVPNVAAAVRAAAERTGVARVGASAPATV
ncbi:NAD-dependent malic enzyme [Miltoncostaea marina]|uniref:NAD-dependent malic enzyme n=1 Tax=Miltoncostaea marina TaxID=2843215 RepID=UPI001C3C28E5|nr:malic enzyme-like NAD(P)-binding protein [Miltoncostaea marina]